MDKKNKPDIIIIPKLEMDQTENQEDYFKNTQSESTEYYYTVANDSVFSSNINELNELNDDSLYLDSIGSFSKSHSNVLVGPYLSKEPNKTSTKLNQTNRNKLSKSAQLNRNLFNKLETADNNTQAFGFIYKFPKKQRKKLEVKNCSKNLSMTANKFYAENERLAKLFDSINLRNNSNQSKKNDESNNNLLNEFFYLDERSKANKFYSYDKFDLNKINEQQRELTMNKLTNRTEKICFKKYVVKKMYKKSIDNEAKSRKYSANSLEKSITINRNNNNNNNNKPIRYSDKIEPNSEINPELNKVIEPYDNNLNDKSFKDEEKKQPESSESNNLTFRIATNRYNSKFEIFKPVFSIKNQKDLDKNVDNNSNSDINRYDSPTTQLIKSQIMSKTSFTTINNNNNDKHFNCKTSSTDNNTNFMTNRRNVHLNRSNLSIKNGNSNKRNLEFLFNIPINLDTLIKKNNKKVVESRCISSLWRNYT